MINYPSIDGDDAFYLLTAMRDTALNMGVQFAFCVLDARGEPLTTHAMTGVKVASIDVAAVKARTAWRNKRDTREILSPSDESGKLPYDTIDILCAQAADSQFEAWGGGVLVLEDGQIAGVLAASGGTQEQDHDVCVEALEMFRSATYSERIRVSSHCW